MAEFPRLHVDEPEPPAPIPFRDHWRDEAPNTEAGTGRRWTREPDRDAASDAMRAIRRAQDALDELDRLTDEDADAYRFRPDEDDDGPRAA